MDSKTKTKVTAAIAGALGCAASALADQGVVLNTVGMDTFEDRQRMLDAINTATGLAIEEPEIWEAGTVGTLLAVVDAKLAAASAEAT